MPEVITKAVPDYTQFGRATKLRLNPNYIEDLNWTIPEEFPLPSKELAPEVSVVQAHAPPPRIPSQSTLTMEGMSFKTKKQDTTWFWSITGKFAYISLYFVYYTTCNILQKKFINFRYDPLRDMIISTNLFHEYFSYFSRPRPCMVASRNW